MLISPLLVMGWFSIPTGKMGWGAIPQVLFGIACLVAAAILMGPPIAELFAKPAGSLYYPEANESDYDPQPDYDIAEKLRSQGLFAEAMSEYEKIAWRSPDKVKPYIEMIDMAFVDLKDSERAEEIYRQALSVIKDVKDQYTLKTMYEMSKTKLAKGEG
jgi:tetratricopeptide (TPR) repeat protein